MVGAGDAGGRWQPAFFSPLPPRCLRFALPPALSGVPNFLPSLEVEGVEEASDEELDEAQVAGTV